MAEKSHKPNSVKIWSRAGKVRNQPIGQGKVYSALFGAFPPKNRSTFPIQELRKNVKIGRFYENRAYQEAKDNGVLF